MARISELKVIAKKHSWTFEELVYDAKATEANQITNAGLKSMYQYLVSKYGKREVICMLRALVIEQRERRKTLHLHQRVKINGAGAKISDTKSGRKR